MSRKDVLRAKAKLAEKQLKIEYIQKSRRAMRELLDRYENAKNTPEEPKVKAELDALIRELKSHHLYSRVWG